MPGENGSFDTYKGIAHDLSIAQGEHFGFITLSDHKICVNTSGFCSAIHNKASSRAAWFPTALFLILNGTQTYSYQTRKGHLR
jgi:hypothetical protein